MSEHVDLLNGSYIDDMNEHGFDEERADDSSGSQLPAAARRALATLVTNRFITRARHRSAWDALLTYEEEIRERLTDLYMLLVVDRDYEVAFKRQDPAEDARNCCAATSR